MLASNCAYGLLLTCYSWIQSCRHELAVLSSIIMHRNSSKSFASAVIVATHPNIEAIRKYGMTVNKALGFLSGYEQFLDCCLAFP